MSTERNWRASDRNILTALQIKTAAPGRHRDGGGLFLEVDDQGKRWVLRIQVAGRRREYGLGSAFKVPLANARAARDDYLHKLLRGDDPTQDKREPERVVVPSFKQAALEVYKLRQASWSNGKHQAQWISSLSTFAFPTIGEKAIDQVNSADVLKILSPIWHTKRETAKRVKQRMGTVLDWAKASRFRSGDNPCDLLSEALGRQRGQSSHFEALPFDQVSKFLLDLRAGLAAPVTKLGFEFLILTAARTKEVRFMSWDELDLDAMLWVVPSERMKAKRPHTVPLSARAVEILRGIAGHGQPREGPVFLDPYTGRALSENRFLNARDYIGYTTRCTPHGFRSSFRDWAAETTHFPSDVVEMALAHAIKSKTEAAYRRGELLTKRRELMEAWATYVLTPLPATIDAG